MYKLHGPGLHQSEDCMWGWSLRTFGSVGKYTKIEPTCKIWHPDLISIGDETYIGNETILKGYPYKGKSIVIGKKCWIGERCYLHGAGGIDIEDRVGMGPGVMILTSQHDPDGNESLLDRPIIFKGVKISEGADIGAGSFILPGITIGKCAVVGMGSVVTHNVPAYEIWAGNPAKKIRSRENSDIGSGIVNVFKSAM